MRVSEIYASVQGEGPRVGQTTVFLRFGGCNLRCPGWPCDTQHAIDPAFRKEWTVWDPKPLAERIEEVAYKSGARLVTLTGGEPFLQNKKDLESLCDVLWNKGFQVEAFTNGTLSYPMWAMDNVSMIVDWKLRGSGEDPLNEMRLSNLARMNERQKGPNVEHAVKFVIKDWADFAAAKGLFYSYRTQVGDAHWYYGRVWEGELTDAQLVKAVMHEALPWRLNVQLHNHIWDPQERGR